MKQLDSLKVYHSSGLRCIELYHGDITQLAAAPVDCLVISAFPNDYTPSPNSLIGSLHKCGVSIAAIAEQKAEDLREDFSCWWSNELSIPASPARRILCFEPRGEGGAVELLAGVFQSLTTMVLNNPSVQTIAMPLLGSGDQRGEVGELLPALLEAAVRWMEAGLPITRLLLVEASELKAQEIKGAFSVLKRQYSAEVEGDRLSKYDVFVSYCQKDREGVDVMLSHLLKRSPALRIFRDTYNFNPGSMWCQEIFDAIEQSRRVVAFLSPRYLKSPMCKQEWNMAFLRQLTSKSSVLFPILMHLTPLPHNYRVVQYQDCVEADETKLASAAEKLLLELRR
jgi:hypothetical protein